ncbi:MAG: peptide ABC transporter substrate-binding protein [Proteobacteria bacterium]|nr:peptide ABC transporter substrate-binding protein [Pseudomonadota bacterium]
MGRGHRRGAGFRLGLLALIVVTIGACGRDREPIVETPSGDGPTFTFAQGAEPRTLDPGFITDTSGGFIAQNLFEGLLVWDAGGAELLPGAAERWEVSPDGKTWTFHLRQGAMWSNGDPVTATDFVLSWRRVLNPDTGSAYASLLYPVKGARDLHSGDSIDPSTLKVEARTRYTLVVQLEAPTPWFAAIAAHHVLSPVNTNVVKRHGHAWTRPDNIVVNGPFTLHDWVPGETIELRSNPYYHSAYSVKLARVRAVFVTDPVRVLSMYEEGDIQWTGHGTGLLPLERLAELADRTDAHAHSNLGTAWYTLNTEHPDLKDRRVRRALSLSLDRTALTGGIGPVAVVADGFVPPGIPGYTPPSSLEYDPDAARALLAEAGFPGGEGFPPLELAVDARNVHEQVAAWVVESWAKELGITVEIYSRAWPAHADSMQARNFQVGRGGWLGDYPDPSTFLDLLVTDNELNVSQWSSETYDGLIEEAARTEDAASRMRLLAQAERIVLEEAPVLPLFHFGSLTLLKPYVVGYEDNAMGVHLLRYLELGTQPGPSMSRGSDKG